MTLMSKYMPATISVVATLQLVGMLYGVDCLNYLNLLGGFGVLPFIWMFSVAIALKFCYCQLLLLLYSVVTDIYFQLVLLDTFQYDKTTGLMFICLECILLVILITRMLRN